MSVGGALGEAFYREGGARADYFGYADDLAASGAVDVGLFYSVTDFLAYSRSAAASFLMTRKSLSFGYSVLGWEVLVLRKSS